MAERVNAPVRVPAGMLAVAVLLWGWHQDAMLWAALAAIAVEAARVATFRWDFGDADFHRLGDVTAVGLDPYLNVDAGMLNPWEDGEMYVLDDGGKVNSDMGNYERFLGIKLSSDSHVTTGKVYNQVIEKERRGDFLGKTVQVVPHVTNAIMKAWKTHQK